MPSFLLPLTLCLAINPQPDAATKPVTDSVEVQALALEIPAIPTDFKKVHGLYKSLRPLMQAQLKDLEVDLKELYAQPGAVSFFAGKLQVEASRKEECQFLLSMLKDTQSEAMEKEILKTWEDWQKLVVESGLGEYQNRSTKLKVNAGDSIEKQKWQASLDDKRQSDFDFAPELSDKEKQVQRDLRLQGPSVTAVNAGQSDGLHASVSMIGGAETSWLAMANRPDGYHVDWNAVYADKQLTDKMQSSIAKAIVGTRIASREIPSLALQWAPLAEHLNQCAKRILEYERQAPENESSDFKLLRMHAKIAFLERFRNVLWFDSLVWALLTSDQLPKPLSPIRATEGLGADIMRDGWAGKSQAIVLPQLEPTFLPASCFFPQLPPLRLNLRSRAEEEGFEKRPWPGTEAFIQARISTRSNPELLAAFRRLARDSREFEEVLRALWREQPKVRLELQPMPAAAQGAGLKQAQSSGSILVEPTPGGFHLVALVQTALVDRGLDQVEPWLGQAVYAAFMTSRQGGVQPLKQGLVFDGDTLASSWDFQRQLRIVLKRDHPEDYEIMLLEAQDRFAKLSW